MKILVVDFLPYAYSSRARKVARTLAELGEVSYLAMARAGRFGVSSDPGEFLDGQVKVTQLPSRTIRSQASLFSMLRNLIWVYLPAMVRLTKAALHMRAQLIVVANPVLLAIALLHKACWRSSVIFIARERPGKIRAKGSLATLVSRTEPVTLRVASKFVSLCVSACDSHSRDYERLGFYPSITIRNVPPLVSAPPPFPDQDQAGGLRLAYIGTLYEGRGLEELIPAVGLCRQRGLQVNLEITGLGSSSYVAQLEDLVARSGNGGITFWGPCDAQEVRTQYARAHVGCVLYAPVDEANDSLPNKLFETMSAGRCVLASDRSEVRAIVEEYDAGIVVPLDVGSLVRGIQFLVEHPDVVRTKADNGWLATQQSLNWESEEKLLLEATQAVVRS